METTWSTSSSTSNAADVARKAPSPSASHHDTWRRDSASSSNPELDDSDADMRFAYPEQQSLPNQQQHTSVCQFVHTQCEKELFTTEYLRSNKASGHKNLRCFPHCCGGHNPKSFCGSGLVVECLLPNCDVVLGRFEEVAKLKGSSGNIGVKPVSTTIDSTADTSEIVPTTSTTIAIGGVYARDELFDDVKVPDQPFGKWFRGTAIPKATSDRLCFLLNGNRQSWHYGWQSSRLNCKNLHVFRVYCFKERDGDDAHTLECIATVASPAFRISSSRKARKTFRSPVMQPLDPTVSVPVSTSVPMSISSMTPISTGTNAAATRVPSIDELLSKRSVTSTVMAPQQQQLQRRSLVEPLTLLEQQRQQQFQHHRAFDTANTANSRAFSRSANGYPTLQRHSIAVSSVHAAAAAAAAAAVASASASATDNDPARRERKRLTRSASLKSDYFATVSFPPLQTSNQTPTPTQTPNQFTFAATHPQPQFAYQQQSTPTLPSVAYMNMNGTRLLNARRSSLAALPMPTASALTMPATTTASSGAPLHSTAAAAAVTTPIMDMMQLRLESPQPHDSYRQQQHQQMYQSHQFRQSQQQQLQQQQRLSLSAIAPSTHLHQHAYASAKPLPFTRRELLAHSTGNAYGSMAPSAPSPVGPPVYFPMIPASSPEGYLNRKRNRSTDSDKGLLAAIQASEALLASGRNANAGTTGVSDTGTASIKTEDATSMTRFDTSDSVDLHRRARVLQLAFTVVKRIHRFEEVSKVNTGMHTGTAQQQPRVYRHSFEMVVPPATRTAVPALVQIPLSNHQLLHLCSSLVTVATALLQNGLLLDLRQRLIEYAQAGVGLYSAYAQIVDYIDDAVHERVCELPKRQRDTSIGTGPDTEPWDLYDLLKHAEARLLQEPWWCATDADDDPSDTSDPTHDSDNVGPFAKLPYYAHFADLYDAVQAALPSPRDLEVAASLRDAALNGVRGLTGEWLRQSPLDDLHGSSSSSARLKSVGSVTSQSAAMAGSLSWLARQIHGHMTSKFHLTETSTTMTLALPNSLVSTDAVFLFDLETTEPTVVVPSDCFPFGWSRKRLLVAYRAWRVRGIGDENGSAVAVQFMRWPDTGAASSDGTDSSDDDDDKSDASDDDVYDNDDVYADDRDANEPEQEPLDPTRPSRSYNRSRRRGSSHARGKTETESETAAALLRTRVTIYFSVFSHNRLQVRTIVEGSMAPVGSGPTHVGATERQRRSHDHHHPTEADMLQYFRSPSSWELMAQVTHEYARKSLRETR